MHCASCTAHNDTQQNIMAAFLTGKLVREKNGRFERHGWEKEVEICGKEGKDSWAKVLKSLQKHPFFLEHGGIFSIKGKPQQVRWSFPLKRAWWPIFFITWKYCTYYPPKFRKKNRKICRKEKRYSRKRTKNRYFNMQIMTTKTTTLPTFYVHVVLNCVICPQILYDIVLYAPHFLPVTFFPKCYVNKVCFELPQNLTWTDE